MSFQELNYFQIDCTRKAEQVAMLQSMRPTRDDRFFAKISTMIQPWKAVTDPIGRSESQAIGTGRTEWMINQKIIALQKNCY